MYSAYAANTLIREEQTLKAYNTDVLAVRDILKPHSTMLDTVLVAGAGGTAKGVVVALKEVGAKHIVVSARDLEKAQAFAEQYDIEIYDGTQQPTCYINTTPVGMKGTIGEHAMPPSAECLRPGMVVFDVVYTPRRTPLVIHAEELDCTVLSGEEMFLRQAWYQFNLFTHLAIPYQDVEEEWVNIQPLIERFSEQN